MKEAPERMKAPRAGAYLPGHMFRRYFVEKATGRTALRKSRQNIILRGSPPRNENSRRKHVEIYR